MNKNNFISENETKYNNIRIMLLGLTILSALSIPYIFLLEKYFVFSSYITQIFASTGLILYDETSQIIYPVVAVVLAVISVLPYLLCWIFSKKRPGWMVAALVIFSIDTLLLLVDFIGYMSNGDLSMLVDFALHILLIVYLAMGVKYGFDIKKEKSAAKPDQKPISDGTDISSSATRQLTIVRNKAFSGSVIPMVCYIDGKEVCRLKNGKSAVISVPVHSFPFGVSLSNNLATGKAEIPAGEDNISYSLTIKSGMVANTIEITPIR